MNDIDLTSFSTEDLEKMLKDYSKKISFMVANEKDIIMFAAIEKELKMRK